MNHIRRYHDCELRAEENDGKRTIAGHAALFYDGTPETQASPYGWFTERVMPEAFDAALSGGDDVRALVNHNPDKLLGRLSAGTLRLDIDKRGLYYVVDLPDTQVGRDTWESIRRGDMRGNSMQFHVTKETEAREDNTPIREIRSVQLFDVGPGTFPVFESTDVQAYSLKDAQRWMAEHKPAPRKLSVRVRHELMTRKRQTK